MTTSGRADVVTAAASMARPARPARRHRHARPRPRSARSDALAVHRGTLTIWQLPSGGAAWTKTQTINVPIQYGSSS